MYQIRTDLALETQEKMQEDKVELKGVRFSEEHVSKNLTISTVVIETENGAKAMEKPKGTYITIEASNMDEEDEDYHREISEQLARVLKQLIDVKKEDVSVLIVGLGNRAVTPDALGPRVVDNLYITRHIINEYGKYAFEVSLFIDGENIASERGELQLTDYGISGIPIFQVSRFATKALKRKQTVTAQIDFLPKLSEQKAEQLFEKRFGEYAHGKTADEAMVGLLNHKLSDVLLKEAHISLKKPAEEITKKELLHLVKQCKHMEVCVTGSKSFEQAQVCAGGVHTDEINPKTMESRLVPNIYFAGEVVDIDGMCGGYNLQWAWSSGYVAGRHAAE